MFDNIQFQKDQALPSKYFKEKAFKPFEYRHLMFYPTYDKVNNRIGSFYTEIGNMRLSYYYRQKVVKLQNSLPKYFAGYNHLNHRVHEYYDGVESLSEITGIDWINSTFIKSEIGTNYIGAYQLSDHKIFYKQTEFAAPFKYGDVYYQKKYTSSYYKLSFYNKWQEILSQCKNPTIDKSTISRDLKRFEIQPSGKFFDPVFKLIGSNMVYDMLNKDTLILLRNKVDGILKSVAFEGGYDLSKINGSDNLKLFTLGKDKAALQKYIEDHPCGYKKNRAKIRELQSLAAIAQPQSLQEVFNNSWDYFLS